MPEQQPPVQGKLEQKAEAVQRHWFAKLPPAKQNEIIKPAFEKAHPTNDSVKQAVSNYENGK